eukprot:scaffold1168_cov46-Skeletonema_dohrnii-CCMP3373.AAC.1
MGDYYEFLRTSGSSHEEKRASAETLDGQNPSQALPSLFSSGRTGSPGPGRLVSAKCCCIVLCALWSMQGELIHSAAKVQRFERGRLTRRRQEIGSSAIGRIE